MADVLGYGPDERGPRRPRRWVAVVGALALAAAAVLLAARATPDRRVARPAPTPAATTATQDLGVLAVAVGAHRLYALAGRCDLRDDVECSYELYRRAADDAGWTRLPLRTAPRGIAGLPQLWVTGDDQVTVLDEPTAGAVYVSADGGDTVAVHRLHPGPPVAALPADGILDLGLCEVCVGRLTVLEPATGRLRPLATQPPLGGGSVYSLGRDGTAIWVAGRSRTGLVSAVSTDSGRSWRAVPVGGAPPGSDIVLTWARPDTGAHLLTARPDDGGGGLSPLALWEATGAEAAWRRLGRPAGPGALLSAVETRRGLLVADVGGRLWRLRAGGGFDPMPPVLLDGEPTPLARMVTGGTGVLLAVPIEQRAEGRVLVSYDDGESWRTDRIEG